MKKTPIKLSDSAPHTICKETGLKLFSPHNLPRDVFISALKENSLFSMVMEAKK